MSHAFLTLMDLFETVHPSERLQDEFLMQREVDLSELLDPAGMFVTVVVTLLNINVNSLGICPFGSSYNETMQQWL